ncbi:MAG TPA: DNA-directed RNA polymerase subunit omega [Terriglobia bacterium]|nr:DNA-directed RNA polymerase subunit omega [Terriglobia bacterium]
MTLPQNMDSKFRFILVAAKRARQLQAGGRALVQTNSKKVTRVAQQEVEAGLVPFDMPELVGTHYEYAKATKSAK